MSRGAKNTVDYFPHICKHGKTIFILENKYNNDGYAVWFKLLELLGQSENHYIDLRNDEDYEFIIAKMKVHGSLFDEIINTLSKLNAIHSELWENKIIWSYNFISNIEDVYKRRNTNCLHFNDLCEHLNIKCKHKYTNEGVIVNGKPQSKVKDSKEEESKEIYTSELNNIPDSEKLKFGYQKIVTLILEGDGTTDLKNLQKLKPLTWDQYLKLRKDYDHNVILLKLIAMDNKKDIHKSNTDIYKTCLNWLKR